MSMLKALRSGILAAFACLAVTACSTTPNAGTVLDIVNVAPPITAANGTGLDEKAGIAAEATYTAWAKAAKLSIQTGLVTNPDTIQWIGHFDQDLFLYLSTARLAYQAGNAASYNQALTRFNEAVALARGVTGVSP